MDCATSTPRWFHLLFVSSLALACGKISGLDDLDVLDADPGAVAGAGGEGGTAGAGVAASAGSAGASGAGASGAGGGKGGASGAGGAGVSGAGGGKGGAAGAGGAGASGTGGGGGGATGGSGGATGGAGGTSGASGGVGGGASGGAAGGAGGASGATTGGSAGATGGNAGSSGSSGSGDVPCVTNASCVGGFVCSKIDVVAGHMSCQAANPAGAAIGATCTGNNGCETKACDTASVCTGACGSQDECGAGNRCVRYNFGAGFLPNLCARQCFHDADCPTNPAGSNTCVLFDDILSDANIFACAYLASPGDATTAGGTFKDVGVEMTAADGCIYGLTATVQGKTYCTRPCTSSADCAGATSTCNVGSITNPSGSGTSLIKVCGVP